MNSRIFFITAFILLLPFAGYKAVSAGNSIMIKISGNSSAVDIRDIINTGQERLSENDLKRICAEITQRYHERGYSAFYIEKAVLTKEGTAELFFNESVVSDITVRGISYRRDDVALSIFTRGDIFNEYTLKENISAAKKKFNIKQLNVTIKRGAGGTIVLIADAVEKIHAMESQIYNSPIYGILPGFTYRINYAGFLAGISISSSFNQADRTLSRASLFFNSDSTPGNSYFNFSADASERIDSLAGDSEIFYKHKSLTSRGGYCFQNGALGVNILLTGTVDKLIDYLRYNGGASFSGLELKLNYNDSLYKIDYDDIIYGEIDFSSGWNFIEDRRSSKLKMNYVVNIPLFSGIFFSFNGNLSYTSDDERYSHFYAYDQFLPCRGGDFSSASLRSVFGVDITYEVMRRTLYIAPLYKWGFHNALNRDNNIHAAGIKLFIKSGSVDAGISYMYDLDYKIRDGLMMFSAGAVY